MKKLLAMLLALAMVVSFAACGSEGDKPSESQSPAPTSSQPTETESQSAEPSQDNTVYTLVASTHTPSTTTATVVFQSVLDEITARSNGRIQFEVFTDGTLAAADGILDALESGIADVAMINYSRQAGRMDLMGVMNNPGIYSNPWEATKAFMELYNTVPAVKEELDSVGVHMMGVQLGTSSVVMSTVPINSLDDLNGLRVITGGDAVTNILTSIGATPMSFSNSEAYEALSKGTADAIASNSLSGAVGFGIQEVAKYVYNINLGAGPLIYGMSTAAYEKLPADLQAIIDEVASEYVPDAVYTIYVQEQGKETTTDMALETAGVTIVEPSAEQIADFQEKYGSSIWDKWVADREAAGYTSAREVMDKFVELCAKHTGTCPF